MSDNRVTDLGPTERLIALARTLAGAWAARAKTCTTAGQERALLRMLGVGGLDRYGRPLAAEVVERYLAGRPGRLAGGVVLPFGAALVEYDVAPQQLALDIASGAIDLALEAEILADPERRQAAEQAVRALAESAIDRIDANRTARTELVSVIGDASRPLIGTSLTASVLPAASREMVGLVEQGVDVVSVSVPPVRELADHLHEAGVELPFWRPRPAVGAPPREDEPHPAPAGSQRGLAEIRQAADAAAAERHAYARLATASLPLAAPEQAIVAAFERVDIVRLDPVAEIVDGSVDPDRALADHAFAHRILARSGATILIGPGPLVVAPDLSRGIPSDAVTRAGRALALQLVAVALAARDGVAPGRIVVGALPAWLIDERDPAAAAIAQVVVRRALLPDHPMWFEEPPVGSRAAAWPAILAAVLPMVGLPELITRIGRQGTIDEMVATTRATASIAREVGSAVGPLEPRGAALELARSTVERAVETLERLGTDGWPSILGHAAMAVSGAGGRIGGEAVAERIETFDPLPPAARGGGSGGPRVA